MQAADVSLCLKQRSTFAPTPIPVLPATCVAIRDAHEVFRVFVAPSEPSEGGRVSGGMRKLARRLKGKFYCHPNGRRAHLVYWMPLLSGA